MAIINQSLVAIPIRNRFYRRQLKCTFRWVNGTITKGGVFALLA